MKERKLQFEFLGYGVPVFPCEFPWYLKFLSLLTCYYLSMYLAGEKGATGSPGPKGISIN